MMKKSILRLMAVLFLAPRMCFAANEGFLLVKTENANGVVIPQRYMEVNRTGFEGYEEFWTPTAKDIELAERRLPAFLASHLSGLRRQVPPPELIKSLIARYPKQRRQYVGLVIGVRRVLHLNFFPPAPSKEVDFEAEWRRQYILVDDGGIDYWRVHFDVERKEFNQLDVNGEA